jgi:hypothetical protein
MPPFLPLPSPTRRNVVLYHRVLGTSYLACWLLVQFSGQDQADLLGYDDIFAYAQFVAIGCWLIGAGGGARLLLAQESWEFRFYIPCTLAVVSVLLVIAGELAPSPVEPFPGPLTYALRDATRYSARAAAVLGAWAGWSTPLPD